MSEGVVLTATSEREALIRRVLAEDGASIRRSFLEALVESINEFVPAMALALQATGSFDEFARADKDRQKVAWLVFSAIQGHLIAMRLFLDVR